ncbi:glycoside hydrolase family 2 TIM barrel-domain containing protein [Modestobacter roseus]|nr:glycoside hydrolase family 2 TIM barrel-domain containing protein [Modestobacter roseus]MQA33756.1 glycoside hydrolase family 2 [Modestobacter roseus]
MHSLRREPEVPLDGLWDFQLLPSPTAARSNRWATVQVPELWTMREPADPPHYTNVPMPFDEVPPAVPRANPTGVYRRTVSLSLRPGRRTVLHVGAAEGLLRAFVNGRPVGLSSDSHLAAEFDVTDAVVEGPNTVELVVSKWSAVSYLEDQDQWWQAGISRSVFLYSVPEVHLADLRVVADLDPATGRGSLQATVQTNGLAHLRDVEHTLQVEVLGRTEEVPVAPRVTAPTLPRGGDDRSTRPEPRLPADFMDLVSLNAASAPIPPEFRATPGMLGQQHRSSSPAGTAVVFLGDLDVRPWSAETPHLEELVVRLVDGGGEVVDETRTRIGFRRVRIEGPDLLVNGRRVLIQGVNRHDVDPCTGRVLSQERQLAELSLLKRCNVNAIRTAHYPNDPSFLDLCDRLGFYVVDEADVEGHAFASTIADDPPYLGAIVERVQRMVARDRNHPSVILWSLGNETGYGAAHDAAAAWVRHADPTRPVHYEGAVATDWHGGRAATDVVCPMYPTFDALRAYSADERTDRPLITCEYAYSQGNSTGGLAEYWELFESLPGLQGGFIWQFTDHALDPDGDGRHRYGGDFGDEPNNGPTLLNGVVFADLTPKPALYEARGLFSPVRLLSGADEALSGRVRLRNRQSFADLSGFELELRVETTAGPLGAVLVPTPDVAAGAEGGLVLPASVCDLLRSPAALALTLAVRTRGDALWAPSRTEVALQQVVLPRRPVPLPAGHAPEAEVRGDGAVEHPVLHRAPRLCLWRALTDNDRSFALDQRFVRSGFFRLTPTGTDVDRSAHGTVVTTRYAAAFGDEVVHRRTVRTIGPGDWVLREEVSLPEGTTDGLRVGVEFELVDGFEQAQWVGLGPWENYPDRAASALLGAWASPIDDLAVPYVLPQENGTRGGVTELRLSGPAGEVRAVSPTPLHLNVSRYTVDQLEGAAHWWELPPSRTTVVHLDVAHRGVGTALLGPDTRKPYRLSSREHAWEWQLTLTGPR